MTLILFIIINLDENFKKCHYSDLTVLLFYKFGIRLFHYGNQFDFINESKIGMNLNKYMGEFQAVAWILSLKSNKNIHGNVFEIIKRITIKVNHYN